MENLGNEIKRYILTLVHIRKRLLKSGTSKKNKADMVQNTEFLEKHLISNTYNNAQMISFFTRHASVIYSIIPGDECKSHASFLKKFGEYYTICNQQ